MTRLLREVASGLAGLLTLLAVATSAFAQDYPSRPLMWVVPFPPGGPTDSHSRLITKVLSEKLGQTVVVENKGGAGGIVGTEYVVNAKPDGYTILYASSGAMTIYQFLHKLSYDPAKSLTPVRGVSESPMLLMVRADSPFKTLADLVAYAKKNPEKVNYATLGAGSTNHIIGEMLQADAKIKMTHIPYKGTAPALADLLAGTVDLAFDLAVTMKEQIEAGKLRALAVSGSQRLARLPDVPTFAEQGYPGVVLAVGGFVMVPAGTPQPVVDRLADALGEVMQSPALVKYFEDQGATSTANFAKQQLADFLAEKRAKVKVIIENAGIKPD
jgi:tripartite-type tricarboxylate transporter receptor subunit TctC